MCKQVKHEKSIHELNLEDDFLFAKVMSDTEICRKVLEQILNIPIKKVESPVIQKTLDILYEGKGIRLDVYVNDDIGTVYNVEMQRGKKKELPKRTRYYQGNIDLDLLSAGEHYTALCTTYIIFICTFDPFQDGRNIFNFKRNCCENHSIDLEEETPRFFLNTRGTLDDVDQNLKEFLTYIENTTEAFASQAQNPLIKDIQKKGGEVKQSKEMEVEYMTLLQRDRENIELGREEGREQGTALTTKILKLYTRGIQIKAIASSLDLDIGYVKQIIQDFEND